jgi:hypothetical protein
MFSSVQVTVEKLERRNLSFSSCSSRGGSCRCGVKSGVSVLLQQHQFILPAGGNQGNHANLTNVDTRAYAFRSTDFCFDPINSKTETSIAEQVISFSTSSRLVFSKWLKINQLLFNLIQLCYLSVFYFLNR